MSSRKAAAVADRLRWRPRCTRQAVPSLHGGLPSSMSFASSFCEHSSGAAPLGSATPSAAVSHCSGAAPTSSETNPAFTSPVRRLGIGPLFTTGRSSSSTSVPLQEPSRAAMALGSVHRLPLGAARPSPWPSPPSRLLSSTAAAMLHRMEETCPATPEGTTDLDNVSLPTQAHGEEEESLVDSRVNVWPPSTAVLQSVRLPRRYEPGTALHLTPPPRDVIRWWPVVGRPSLRVAALPAAGAPREVQTSMVLRATGSGKSESPSILQRLLSVFWIFLFSIFFVIPGLLWWFQLYIHDYYVSDEELEEENRENRRLMRFFDLPFWIMDDEEKFGDSWEPRDAALREFSQRMLKSAHLARALGHLDCEVDVSYVMPPAYGNESEDWADVRSRVLWKPRLVFTSDTSAILCYLTFRRSQEDDGGDKWVPIEAIFVDAAAPTEGPKWRMYGQLPHGIMYQRMPGKPSME